MAKPSAFLQRMEAKHRQDMRLQRLFTIQQCEDMMLITLGQDFGFGPKRARRWMPSGRPSGPLPGSAWRTQAEIRRSPIPRRPSTGSCGASWGRASARGRSGTRRRSLSKQKREGTRGGCPL